MIIIMITIQSIHQDHRLIKHFLTLHFNVFEYNHLSNKFHIFYANLIVTNGRSYLNKYILYEVIYFKVQQFNK